MTTRADLIKAGAAAARLNGVGSWEHLAAVVLDAVLPQITTEAELGALSGIAVVMRLSDGQTYHVGALGDMPEGEWVVVWQPSVDRVTT